MVDLFSSAESASTGAPTCVHVSCRSHLCSRPNLSSFIIMSSDFDDDLESSTVQTLTL